jgi:hypothetical protein
MAAELKMTVIAERVILHRNFPRVARSFQEFIRILKNFRNFQKLSENLEITGILKKLRSFQEFLVVFRNFRNFSEISGIFRKFQECL